MADRAARLLRQVGLADRVSLRRAMGNGDIHLGDARRDGDRSLRESRGVRRGLLGILARELGGITQIPDQRTAADDSDEGEKDKEDTKARFHTGFLG